MIVSLFYEKWSKTMFMMGVVQLMLAYLLVGWFLSVFWSYLFVKKALEDQAELKSFLDSANAKSDSVGPAFVAGFAAGRR